MERLERYEQMRAFDSQFGFPVIAGVDEAGRGPLAGPVVAAAVILPPHSGLVGVDDSKKLTEPKRDALFEEISRIAISIGVGVCDEKTIDEINILQATFLAMKKAVCELKGEPGCLLIDGNMIIPGHFIDRPFPVQKAVEKGDGRSLSIAAASIVAKVTRDRLMVGFDEVYPGYGFAKHKGYPTKAHKQAVIELGDCEIHRKSFLKGISRQTTAGR